MLFKDIKQNYPVYILNKQDLSLTQGKAVQVPFPRMEMNQKTGKTEMVVDITIEANGKTATYVIPENLSVTYAGNLILSTDKMSLASEIEAMLSSLDTALTTTFWGLLVAIVLKTFDALLPSRIINDVEVMLDNFEKKLELSNLYDEIKK